MGMLTLGPTVGAVTHDSVKLWFRTEAPEACRVEVRTDEGAHVPGSPFDAPTLFRNANVACIEIPLPRPYRYYTYDVLGRSGESVLPEGVERPGFWSAPPPDAVTSFSFGVVSCDKPDAYDGPHRPDAMWRRLARARDERDLAFLLAVGDQVYADDAWRSASVRRDVTDRTLRALYRRSYERQWGSKASRVVHANLPTYRIWDDHEIRNGWGSKRRDATDARYRARFTAARSVYRRFQHATNPRTFSNSALHYGFTYGDVGVLVLDLRGHRRWTDGVRHPLMGTGQWRDVRRWVREHDLGALFVVTSVPVFHIKQFLTVIPKSDLRDQWSSPRNRPEREELLTLLFDTANESDIPVVLVGGDVHVGTIACLRSSLPRHERRPTLYQLTSSPISNNPAGRLITDIAVPAVDKEVALGPTFTGRILECHSERNYGVVDVEYDEPVGRYRVVLNLALERGGPVRRPLQG